MTLVLSASISGSFAIMTSDTRKCYVEYKYIDHETGKAEIDHNQTVPVEGEKDIKTHRISKSVLMGFGGNVDSIIYLKRILYDEIKPDHDLSDCKKILEAVIKRTREKKEGPDDSSFFNIDEGVNILMNGFYRDGSTGLVMFKGGKNTEVEEFKCPIGQFQYSAIAPAKEYLRNVNELFNIPKLTDPSTYEEVPETEISNVIFQIIMDHLILIHGVASTIHSVEISPDFEVLVIANNKNGFEYNTQKYDLTGIQHFYKTISNQLNKNFA